jgi:hypothetical protein
MGFKINQEIQTNYGSTIADTYCTIKGLYRIERRESEYLNLENNRVESKASEYYICSSGSLFISKQAYLDKKVPIVFNITLEHLSNITELQESDIYELLYTKLKEKLKERYGNHLTFEDDI